MAEEGKTSSLRVDGSLFMSLVLMGENAGDWKIVIHGPQWRLFVELLGAEHVLVSCWG